jgi:hypothetical protein
MFFFGVSDIFIQFNFNADHVVNRIPYLPEYEMVPLELTLLTIW